MTILLDDPLIAGMSIPAMLPLHESSRRLRELYPECPRVHGVAVLGDVARRRWWPLQRALTTDRLHDMFTAAATEMDSRPVAARQLAATLTHTVIGRVVALVVLEGRAWDTGLENLWVHVDSDGVIDWAAVVDPTLRVLADDRCPTTRAVVRLPNEAALATWVAHRCHRTLGPLFDRLHLVSGGVLPVAAMWHLVGAAIVTTATQVPQLAGASELSGMRRAQAVLDALVGFGLPVRGPRNPMRQGLARLGQPCLC